MNDKIYINGIIIKEKNITGKNGDFSVMNISINIDEFMESVGKIYSTDNNGKRWANISMKKRSEPSQSGVTHYVVPNDWKPKKDEDPLAEARAKLQQPDSSDIRLEDIPF